MPQKQVDLLRFEKDTFNDCNYFFVTKASLDDIVVKLFDVPWVQMQGHLFCMWPYRFASMPCGHRADTVRTPCKSSVVFENLEPRK